MSPRKKNASKASPSKQSTINSFFRSKPKHAPTSTRPKRLAQSSLAARPLRSNRSPDLEILDLTQSTSPAKESDSPPSAKKRKLKATSPDRSPIRGVRQSPFPPDSSRSPSPTSYISGKAMESGPGSSAQRALASPAPSQTGSSRDMLEFDPDETIESSQTQYLHLVFTPSSQRVAPMDPGHVPTPVFTPTSTRSKKIYGSPSVRKTIETAQAIGESQSTPCIPSSQGEVYQPSTPRKYSGTVFGCARTSAPNAEASRAINSPTDIPTATTEPTIHPASAKTPTKNHLARSNLFTPNFSSPRPIPTPLYSSNLMSSSDPSIEATELGTVESPPKPPRNTTTITGLLPHAPLSRLPGQNTPLKRQRAITPLLPIHNINPNPPRTPSRATQCILPLSPTEFPSPGKLMSSLGFEPSRSTSDAKQPTLAKVFSDPPNSDSVVPSHDVLEATHSQLQENGRPNRSRSSSLTIIPSSQPLHDSSPPPGYSPDPKRHSFNQSRMQSFNQLPIPAQQSEVFESQLPTDWSRPYSTVQTNYSPVTSSQSLPPSQSPIKGGQIDPNQSAAGMRGVFGMLGFGSEADHNDDSEVHRDSPDEEMGTHTPIVYDLPPSSPPPQTPTRRGSRASSPDLSLIPVSGQKGKAKSRIGKTPIRDSPLIHAFEAAKKRSKTATPVVRRSAPKASQIPSSPIGRACVEDMELHSSPIRVLSSGDEQSPPKISKSNAGLRTLDSAGIPQKSSQTAQQNSSRNIRPIKASTSTQRRKSIEQDVVDSSDADEMDIDIRPSPALPASTRATAGARESTEPMKPIVSVISRRDRSLARITEDSKGREHTPQTPARHERLPSSVSPSLSPIHPHLSPVGSNRSSSPPIPENTQTQEECETPWESLRPSQSVSQVYERQLIEEAERARRLRMGQNAQKQNAKVLVEESPDVEQEDETGELEGTESEEQSESQDQEPARPVTISLEPQSPTNVPNELSRRPLPHWFSTPKSQRIAEQQHYVVTPTKVMRRTPARPTPSRKSMTPSSMMGEDDPNEDYTYIEETFNPTESQQSFLNRILLGDGSQMD
ncbi:hypothetical protein RHS04_03605 [Rhizoctonia solani]|uniref:Uncharacterized protein n=1 Tax=Rhizoctonia solani TaxID=456999 RepID=A0A8H7H990_9AGAM|nr:hypothetical protein RHS04_03605 [Rhizoctonia solani]